MLAAKYIHHRTNNAQGAPGEVVTARFGAGGYRTTVLVARTPGGWRAVRCTTKRDTSTGFRRAGIPNPSAVGLHQPFWLRAIPVEITDTDLGMHVGWADHALADTITSSCAVRPADAASLHRAVAHRAVRAHLTAFNDQGRP